MNPEVAGPREQLLAEREELGRTVQALADRFDVGARAKAAAGNAHDSGVRVWDHVVRSRLFVPVATAVAAGLTLIGVAAWMRRRRSPTD